MRSKYSILSCFVFINLLLSGFVTNAQNTADSLSKYSHDELIDKAFETRSTLYLDYLEKQKLSQDEKKLLYTWYYYLTAENGDLDITLKYLQKLDSISKLTNDPNNQFNAKMGAAEVYYKKSEYAKSKEAFLQAEKFVESFADGTDRVLAKAEYDYFYYLSGNFDVYNHNLEVGIKELQAIKTDKMPLEEKRFHINSIATLAVNLACGYILKEDFDHAEKNLKLVDDIYAENFKGDTTSTFVHEILVKGKYHFFKKEFEKAIPFFKEVIDINQRKDFKEDAYMAKVFLGMAYYQLEDYQQSLDYLENAINNHMLVADYIKYEMESYRYASLASKELGDTEKTLRYSGLYMEQDEALNDNKRSTFINSFINNLEVGKLQKDISAKESTNFKLRYILFGLAILIAGLGVVLVYQIKENKKNKKKIQDYLEQLSQNKKNKDLALNKKDAVNQEAIAENQSKEIDDKTARILDKLEEFEEGELFVDSKMSLAFLASYLETNTITLSKIINTHKEMNFNDYINGLRIRYIIEKIKNEPKFDQYKISYLAEVSGFSSHSIFSKAFKKSTGVTPSQFLDYLKEETV
ncbi:helix-turn-helix domain-containing protein [Sphingobacterium sp. WM]|uniref:AraC family transcriptional regulator n=1 Tax=Sphingobacterium sp. WM TaxID=3031802 RepID=UPI00240D6C38|nr:AraC family transcriptional regulator [Sphingobacterium sp. WM]WFB62383.1 helix-turn-helix domain-containing protein [Sphingobacterium sp. WM]